MADPARDAVALDILGGWRTDDGTHIAGVRLTLADGWKTYWRSPGDAGIPPSFSWTGTRNVEAVHFHWPVPEVHDQNGMRTLGYAGQVVIPIEVVPDADGQMRLKGKVQIGVCKDICVPKTLRFNALLPETGAPDGQIAAALINQPLSAKDANMTGITCKIAAVEDGIRLHAEISMPALGRDELAVIEVPQAHLWVSEADVVRSGNTLTASVDILSPTGGYVALDRSELIFTVMAGGQAVEAKGCTGR
ncbi:protein-disulfide reductase DsbD domain-containing protein [Nereida sp. MMG025]|uniref:protein-disulfide reductase DsbD domain-containing protein n=1 Tax=Nereida sp. MMG025 TaxID=2909981 RepID=UPI001F410972|nr:protein-disulfide reductase DsbD domain-containing protein [Nereida sp. MMG025]MCF6444379.1 hypothetical protein [Nereida sp. MMG025]